MPIPKTAADLDMKLQIERLFLDEQQCSITT